MMNDRDVTLMMGKVLTQAFNLKLMHWGKGQEGSEVSGNMSWQMGVLQAIGDFPQAGWPQLPVDADSIRLMGQGINLNAMTARNNRFVEPFNDWMQILKITFEGIRASQECTALRERRRKAWNDAPDLRTVARVPVSRALAGFNGMADPSAEDPIKQMWPAKPCVTDLSNDRRVLEEYDDAVSGVGISGDDIHHFSSLPLLRLPELSTLLSEPKEKPVVDVPPMPGMPFNIQDHPEARSVVAKQMCTRVEADIATYKDMMDAEEHYEVLHLTPAEAATYITDHTHAGLGRAIDILEDLVVKLTDLREADARTVERCVLRVSDLTTEIVPTSECNRTGSSGAAGAAGESKESKADVPPPPAGGAPPLVSTASGWLKGGSGGPAAEKALERDELERKWFTLQRYAGARPSIPLEFALSTLLSTRGIDDLLRANPYMKDPPLVHRLLVSLQLHTCRVAQCNRSIGGAKKLLGLLTSLKRSASQSDDFSNRLSHATGSLVAALRCRRYSISSADDNLRLDSQEEERKEGERKEWDGVPAFDPRFLVFEFMFDIVLRKRQVEMVMSFKDRTKRGDSSCQQMIMGAGKTTVIGPLLALCLADGNRLVMQVMPTSLLHFTRECMRNIFTSIIPKRVYTLEFERGIDDDASIAERLHAKLSAARRHRGVVCAAPECVKSLMLKFVEQLHVVEAENFAGLVEDDNTSQRARREIRNSLRDMQNRSDMADALVPIINMWKEGVVIMDEVDLLLHPLKSELNFPIGDKDPIDMGNNRWDLPFHLLQLVFTLLDTDGEDGGGGEEKDSRLAGDDSDVPALPVLLKRLTSSSGHSQMYMSEEAIGRWEKKKKELGLDEGDILSQVRDALMEGRRNHKLQRIPHLVLLDPAFYTDRLLPLVCQWSLLWLHQQFTHEVHVDKEAILAYLAGDAAAITPAMLSTREDTAPQAQPVVPTAEPLPELPPPNLADLQGFGAAVHRGPSRTDADQGKMVQLQSMGVPVNASRRALTATKNNLEEAIAWVFSHQGDGNYDDALGEDEFMEYPGGGGGANGGGGASGGVEPDRDVVQTIMGMGFSENGAERAAVACNNASAQAAMEWALGHSGDVDFDLPRPEKVRAEVEAAAAAADANEAAEKKEAEAAVGVTETEAKAKDTRDAAAAEGAAMLKKLDEQAEGADDHLLTKADMKMLNLTRDWTTSFLPHCLGKIDRVTYGLLGPNDAGFNSKRTPESRRLMAVPFIGKDVRRRESLYRVLFSVWRARQTLCTH